MAVQGIMNYPQVDNVVPVFSSELDDLLIETRTMKNAGAGWNYTNFTQRFKSAPTLVAQVINFEYNIYVKNITKDGFNYKIKNGTEDVSDTSVPFNFQAIEYGGDL